MKNVKPKDVIRSWHQIDASGQILGRLSTNVANLLSGKNKPYYTPYIDTGDYVVVVNAKKVAFSGKKETQKTYFRHSGFPGGLKTKTVSQVRQTQPEKLIRHSVTGMLPKGKLGRAMIKKLYIYPESENPYKDKFNK